MQAIIELCRQSGVKSLVWGDMQLEMHANARSVAQQQTGEYTASRGIPSDPDSMAALQVAAMNREQEAWTNASAPNVFQEHVND